MNVAIVGAGRMGSRHYEVAHNLGLNFLGFVDISVESLNRVGAHHELDSSKLFLSLEALLSKKIPDILIISTTADSHCFYASIGAQAGVKHILIEKPLATSIEECKKILEICDANNVIAAVNHQMRFMEQYYRPKEILASEKLGGICSMTIVAGNFGVSMNGTHYFEAFRYLVDEEIKEVSAHFSDEIIPNPRGQSFFDRAGQIRAISSSGKRFYMEIGSDQGHGVQVIYAGRNGFIYVNELNGEMIVNFRESQYRDLPTVRYGMPSESERYQIAPAELIDSTGEVLKSLIRKDSNLVSLQNGFSSIKALVAAYMSAENHGVSVSLDQVNFDEMKKYPWA